MKYLLVNKSDVIEYISDTIGYQENGNYLIHNESLAVPPTIATLFELETIPSYIEPEKWCFIDGEFVPNPNWVEPEPPEEPIDVDRIIGILRGEIE